MFGTLLLAAALAANGCSGSPVGGACRLLCCMRGGPSHFRGGDGPIGQIALCAAKNGTVPSERSQNEQPAAPPAEQQADLGALASRLGKLGLQITADARTIGEATSEAAYFMFAQRKDHRPHVVPFEAPKKGHWLDGKPVFTAKAERDAIGPLFDQLIEQMGYNEVSIYAASVHYGVDGFARFTLYKLGYREGDQRRGKQPEVLLGDADYVLGL